ncbi:MAG: hypothetical protein K8H90_01405 [Thermoanaerobaculia bacterium]|nr:hypothetical protein [Thermoanaerobaculia bacterium]
MNFGRVLTEVREQLDRCEVRFALAGGVAVAAHGVQRTTLDLDLVVASAQSDAAVAALESLGFETLRRSAAFSNHLRADSGERVDLLFVAAPTAAAMFARAVVRDLFGAEGIAVVDAEHLVAMKLFAIQVNPTRAGLDLEDVRALMARGLVDGATVSVYLDRYGLGEHRKTLGL